MQIFIPVGDQLDRQLMSVPITELVNDTTRLVVRVLDGKDLLASDIMTGKSDPICFVWCSSKEVSNR